MLFSDAALSLRKSNVAHALNQILKPNEWLLVFCGDPIQKPGGHDQNYDFLPHPDYFWLTGSRRPHGICAYSKDSGWVDFVRPVTREEKIWEGGGNAMPGKNIKDFDGWIASLKGARLITIGQTHSHANLNNVSDIDRAVVQEIFNEVRRAKDAEEVALIRKLADMANFGYKKLKQIIRPGISERHIQLEYENEVLMAGAEKMPYGSIVGTGSRSAVLHAVPTSRIVKAGEHVLIDAGADVEDYCVDITRNFAADGDFTFRQRSIYNLVLAAQTKSINLMKPGVMWKDVHLASAMVMAEGLKDLGILKTSAQEAVETGAISVFFPHGVGHMVGLKVRDVGGPPNPDPKKYGGARLRVDIELKENYLMTVEPGLYFIEALLNDEETRKNFADQINWNEAQKWADFGGFRIEDDILVTSTGPVNLTEVVEKL
jgi:Xaa-Pro dipeptidase